MKDHVQAREADTTYLHKTPAIIAFSTEHTVGKIENYTCLMRNHVYYGTKLIYHPPGSNLRNTVERYRSNEPLLLGDTLQVAASLGKIERRI